ncbi:hypothetical protein F5Y19DRAFT_423614 [Xylariaceae sp. FL1651]|nr:hypothetical protein F5Y19DRAFT_423614 [Xylariaceae sp. FL1651]
MSTSSDTGEGTEIADPPQPSSPPSRYRTPAVRKSGETSLHSQWEKFLAKAEVDTTVKVTKGTDQAPDTFSATNKRFWNLAFSSTKNKDRFSVDSAEVDAASSGTVLIALDAGIGATPSVFENGANKITLGDVLTKFGVVSDSLTGGIITAIGTSVEVVVDTSKQRNGFWCIPGPLFRVDTNLFFKIGDNCACSLTGIATALGNAFGLSIDTLASKPTFRLQYTVMGIPSPNRDSNSFSISSTFNLTVKLAARGFIFWLRCTAAGFQCTLSEDPSKSDNLWTKLSMLGGSNSAPTKDAAEPDLQSDIFPTWHLWDISIFKNYGQSSLRWRVRFILMWKSSGGDSTSIPLLLSYDSADSTFTGALLFNSSFPNSNYKFLPWYSPLAIPTNIQLSDGFDLAKLFPVVGDFSSFFPTTLTNAIVSYNKDHKLISLSATLSRSPTNAFTPAPLSPFTWDGISLSIRKDSAVSIDVLSSFALNPRESSNIKESGPKETARLHTRLSYANSNWDLNAAGANIPFKLLWSYFDEEVRAPILSVLGDLEVRSLDLDYTYGSQARATSFLFTGMIALGSVELRLFYQYATREASVGGNSAAHRKLTAGDPKPITVADGLDHDWAFECDLAPPDPFNDDVATTSVGTIADCLAGGASTNLPDFVRFMAIREVSDVTSATLRLSKTSQKGIRKIVFVLSVKAGAFEITFAQISGAKQSSGLSSSATQTQTKRILRVTAQGLPTMRNIPLVNELPPLFQELVYMWVTPEPLTGQDIETINSEIGETQPFLYRVTSAKQAADSVIFKPGHHFLLVQDTGVILDHLFDYKPKSPSTASEGRNPDPAPANGSLVKKSGLISISGLGLQYKTDTLWFNVDGTLFIGPIAVTLLGLGVGIPLIDVRLDSLETIVGHLQWHLDGLAIILSRPPLLIAGVFEHVSDESRDTYRGGIALSIPPYTFVAVGEYTTVTLANKEYKSVFMFAKLDGPLITLEFATISGIRLGFGYNSFVRSPSSAELYRFPFINDSDLGTTDNNNNPMSILESMCKPQQDGSAAWVAPREDAYWLAIGMTIAALDMLSITAVALVSFRDSGIIISLIANAVAQLPPKAEGRGLLLLYAELDMISEINFNEGYFRTEGALAPSSFLLVPWCRLHGGFGIAYWFGASPFAGDWVFSIGGYHPAFSAPSHYPTPARVGVSFQVGNNVHVQGDSYFAITPSFAMAGALIQASLNVGPVKAWFDAGFDSMISFHPLHYEADMHISVGIGYDMDVWFIHTHVEVHVGAELHMEGPEFGGKAHVNFYLFAFDIYFGAAASVAPPLDLHSFWRLVHQPGPVASSSQKKEDIPITSVVTFKHGGGNSVDTVEDSVGLKFILEDGAFSMPSNSQISDSGVGAKWYVKGGSLRFRISCDFVVSEATLGQDNVASPSSTPTAFYSKPMQVNKPISSKLSVSVKPSGSQGSSVTGWRDVKFISKPAPMGLYGQYSQAADPIHNKDARTILSGAAQNTADLAVGISLLCPESKLAKSKIPAFNATEFMKEEILSSAHGSWIVDSTPARQTSCLPDPTKDPAPAKDENDESPWELMKESWRGMHKKGKATAEGQNMLELCASSLGWDQNTSNGEGGKPWKLSGNFPERLVGRLEEYYPSLPRIGVM